MLKLLRLLLALVGVIVIVMLAVNNRHMVEIGFWPFPVRYHLPLYAVVFLGLFLGALLGGTAMWLSSRPKRREARTLRRKMRSVEYQERLKREREEQEILEQARTKTRSLSLPAPQV